MLNINKFIGENITSRPTSLFASDIEANKEALRKEIEGSSLLVIGGAGSIGSSYIRAILPFRPSRLVVVDLSENGLAELTRDLRSTYGMYVPDDYRTYTLNFSDPIFERIFREEKGFDIVANFSAHKHVRSEKDKYSVQALIENNVIKAKKLLDLLSEYPPRHFFCVSTEHHGSQQTHHGGHDYGLYPEVQGDNGKICQCRFFQRLLAGRFLGTHHEETAPGCSL